MSLVTNESAENYLETILLLGRKFPVVRAVDISTEMGFKKSSVSVALKGLREKGYTVVSEQGFIELTDEGKNLAEMVYARHELLTKALEKIGVPSEIAAEDACRIEHVISPETFEALKKVLE